MQADIFRIWLAISDNGPWYTVDVFTSVMNAYHVNHITSTPHYPQSNGVAEKYIQIVKSFILQGKRRGERPIQMLDDLLQYTS